MERLDELVIKYYKKENGYNYSCSESMIRALDECYNLNLPVEVYKCSCGFSRGAYGAGLCGAISSCIAALSFLYNNNGHAHDSELMQQKIEKFNELFYQQAASFDCVTLKAKFHTPETRCLPILLMASKALASVIEEDFAK